MKLGLLVLLTVWVPFACRVSPRQPPPRGPEENWIELFNGKDLAGWRQRGGGRCCVENGTLILEHDPERRPGYLIADHPPLRDFHAVLVCRVPRGDSGFFFRGEVHPVHDTEFQGPQVQLNAQPGRGLGGIFEHHGRGWVCKPPAAQTDGLLAQPEEWFTCEIVAHGPKLRVWINNVLTVAIADAGSENHFQEAGRFALQIHGGGWCRAEFRRFAVKPLEGKAGTE